MGQTPLRALSISPALRSADILFALLFVAISFHTKRGIYNHTLASCHDCRLTSSFRLCLLCLWDLRSTDAHTQVNMEELRKTEKTQLSFMPVLTAKRKPTEKHTHRSTTNKPDQAQQPNGNAASSSSLPSTDDTDSGPQVHERLYSDATKWRERQAHKVALERANPDPNCTFSPTVELSAKSLKTNAQSSSMPMAEIRPRFEVLYEDSKVREVIKKLST